MISQFDIILCACANERKGGRGKGAVRGCVTDVILPISGSCQQAACFSH
jgi:hypothetical protein